MAAATLAMKNGRFIGYSACEIDAVPTREALGNADAQAVAAITDAVLPILHEAAALYEAGSTAIELFYAASPAEKKEISKARIHIFLLIRRMTSVGESAALQADQLAKEIANRLGILNYHLTPCEPPFKAVQSAMRAVDASSAAALIRGEKISGGVMAAFPYYHCDPIPASALGFNAVVNALSDRPGSALSIQIINTRLNDEEALAVVQMRDNLMRVVNGIPSSWGMYSDPEAAAPLENYRRLGENPGQPFFSASVVAYGPAQDCAALIARFVSFLQANQDRGRYADLRTADLSDAGLNPAAQWPYLPWNVDSLLVYKRRNLALWQNMGAYRGLFRLPFLFTPDEAASLMRLPYDDGELRGVAAASNVRLREQLDASVLSLDNITFGHLPDGADITVGAPLKAFTKHALVVGMPGTGKTTFAVNLLLQFCKKGVPFLAIEPTKTEYRGMISAIPSLQIFTPGNNRLSPFIINPFLPPRGVRLEQYVPALMTAFTAAFDMVSPLDAAFLRSVNACYTQYGWKSSSRSGDPDVTAFGLYEFIATFRRQIAEMDYSAEVKGNLQSAGTLRLMNLIEQNANIYDNIHSVPIEDLLNAPCVLELNAIDNLEMKSLIMALLLINVCLYTRISNRGDGELQNVILVDEAHVLFGAGEGRAHATTLQSMNNMIREIRSLGTGIIIADQSPSVVGDDIAANTDIKVAFRLVQSKERAVIADTCNMDSHERDALGTLGVGRAFAYYSQTRHPVMIETEDIRRREGITTDIDDDAIARHMHYWDSRRAMLRPFRECTLCPDCHEDCDFALRDLAGHHAARCIQSKGGAIQNVADAERYTYYLSRLIPQGGLNGPDYRRVCNCARIRFLRNLRLRKSFEIPPGKADQILRRAILTPAPAEDAADLTP